MPFKLTLVFTFSVLVAFGQFPDSENSAEIYHQLLKLKETSRVLYIAAHPDDENTRLISYLENGLHAQVGYLSLTRGDGGQNLIGTEIGDGIGLLRTQELLRARQIDGGEQFFTRAVDFGFSKSAEESLEKWNEEVVLSDVVWIIRYFKPDVIITRFPPTRDAGHGHHESSALLAAKAYDMAADPNAYPEQLNTLSIWKTKRMYFNATSWWDKGLAERAANNPDYAIVNVGEYDPLLGETYSQIAARSRSQHRSQGFGSDYPYGLQVEYLQYVKGERIMPGANVISGLNNEWTTLNLKEIGLEIDQIISGYDFVNPSSSIPKLSQLGQLLKKAEKSTWIDEKINKLNSILFACSGAAMQFTTNQRYTCPGNQIKAEFRAVNTTQVGMQLLKLDLTNTFIETDTILYRNIPYQTEIMVNIPENAAYSNPYWLKNTYSNTYNFNDKSFLALAENKPDISIQAQLRILDYDFSISLPLLEKYVDPAKQVIFTPVYIVPQLTAQFYPSVLISADTEPQQIQIELEKRGNEFSGELRMNAPKGWTVEPKKVEMNFGKNSKNTITVQLSRTADAQSGEMTLTFIPANSNEIDTLRSLQEIKYDHIPSQIILHTAGIHCTSLNLDRGGVQTIGYIDGSGDLVANSLIAAGYDVSILNEGELLSIDALKKYDAIVTGIRAYNTRDDLTMANNALSEYVKNGGMWLVQYNTSRGLKSDHIGPIPFSISRDRVTEEDAKVEFLMPKHSALNYPNIITESDFNNWVQERGLYFAETWDSSFSPLLGWHDRNENQLKGSLIVAPYGKGYFVYSGISFFRQLPAGVPGAYRLLANILALSLSDQKLSNE